MTRARVRLALLRQLGPEALGVEVRATGRKVHLVGTLSDRAAIDRAREIAGGLECVETVDTDLRIAPHPARNRRQAERYSDALLGTRVELELLRELGSGALEVEVSANAGKVALSGDLPRAQRELAKRAAQTVRGDRRNRRPSNVFHSTREASAPSPRCSTSERRDR